MIHLIAQAKNLNVALVPCFPLIPYPNPAQFLFAATKTYPKSIHFSLPSLSPFQLKPHHLSFGVTQ